MPSLIIDLLVLIAVLGIAALMLAGWGTIVGRLLRLPLAHTSLAMLMWLGFAAVLLLTQALHLFTPIDWRATLVLSTMGIAAAPRARFALAIRKLLSYAKGNPLVAALWVGWLVLCCMRAMGVPNNFDSGLYHFQSIRWLNEEALAIGLGNLHWRLALNQSYFGFLALLNVAPYWGHGYAAGGLFLVLLSYASVWEFLRNQRLAVRFLVGIVLVTTVTYYAGTLANPSPDTAVALIQVPIVLWLLRLLAMDRATGDEAAQSLATALTVLSVAVVSIKLSSLAFAGVSVLIAAVGSLRIDKLDVPMFTRLCVYVVLAVGVHIGTGYLLSGYPFFPATLLGNTALPWALPAGQLEYETKLIYSWARAPGVLDPDTVLNSWSWLSAWFIRLPAVVWLPLVMGAAFGLVNSLYLCGRNGGPRVVLLSYLPLVAALAFWFVTAPDPRFLGTISGLFLSLSLFIFVQVICTDRALNRIERGYSSRGVQLSVVALFVLCNLKLVGLGALSTTGWATIPQPSLQENRSAQGVLIYTGAVDSQCWNANLPCATAFDPKLHITETELIPNVPVNGLSRKVISIR